MKINKKIVLSISTSLILTNISFAQDINKLDIITVSAQKSKENIQNVPINITKFDEFDIEDKKIKKIKDIGAYTPNLMLFSYGGDKQLAPSLRGIFSDIESRTVPVGIYIDDVPILDGWAMNQVLDDIESIEVLKGPQGTLYGKNTETGVINIYTKQPSNENISNITMEYGSDKKIELQGKVSGAIIKDKLFASLLLKHYEKDGLIKDKATGKNIDDREQNSAKLTLRSIINDNLELSFINSYTKYNDGGQRMSYTSQTKDNISSDFENYDKSSVMNNALKIKYDISNDSYIESITTRRDIDNDTANDWDFTNDASNPWKFHVKSDESIDSYSQEFRYKKDALDNKLNLLLGVYGDKKEDKFYYTQFTAGGDLDKKIDLNDKSLGIFTHASYKLNPKSKILFGLRYDKETKKYKQTSLNIDTKEDYNALSPKLSFEYDFDTNKMLYSTISKGYRAGGFNYLAPKGHKDIAFDEESLISYELGSKITLMDSNLRINTSIYYMDIDDMQVTNAVSPTEEFITNAAKAHSIGLELETNYKINENIQTFLSFGLNETKFDNFSDTKGDYKDKTNPFAPKYNFNIGAQYRTNKGYFARFDINGYGKMYFDKENKYKKDAYRLVNTKIGYEADNYDIYLYAKNLFDKNHDSKGYYSGNYTYYNEPREVGVQLAYRF